MELRFADDQDLRWLQADGDSICHTLAHSALDHASRQLARAMLSRRVARRGDRVLLAYVPGPNMAIAVFASIRAGFVAGEPCPASEK